MKNLHILPTDKPSRLYLEHGDGQICLSRNFLPQTSRSNNQSIYITSDEALPYDDSIFDNGAFYHRDAVGDVYIITKHTFKPNPHFCKRIILTTDQDLIKDGVQAIDDEFLEWFVKNPSCEFVEWSSEKIEGSFDGEDWKFNYGIVIPKEEPKQETLEEAAREYYKRGQLGFEKAADTEMAFLRGGLWQQERMYREEDMKQFAFDCVANFLSNNDNKVEMKLVEVIIYRNNKKFEQFKKK